MFRLFVITTVLACAFGEEGFCSIDDQFHAISDRLSLLEAKLEEKPKPEYDCYVWTTADLDAMPTERTQEVERAQCESHTGNVYTHGDNANYTGCGDCNCCKHKPTPQYNCYAWTAADSKYIHAAYSVAREKERCESYPDHVFTQGNNVEYPGCSACWCCSLVKETQFVGFTAYLSKWAMNLPLGKPVVLDSTVLNEGGAYSTSTGQFTAPVDGYYSFTFSVETRSDGVTDSNIVVKLVVDGQNMLNVVVEPRTAGQNLSGSNAGVLKLKAGQKVWLEPYQELNQDLEGGDIYRFTTFSGALVSKL